MEQHPGDQEGFRKKEIVLSPQIIRPLARAINQRLQTNIDALRKILSPDQKAILDRLQSLERAKEVILIEDVPLDPNDPSTFGIETPKEMETEINIPLSTTTIEGPLMQKLGLALQDYLLSPLGAIRGSDETNNDVSAITSFLRTVTNAPKLIINNTADNKSVFQDR